LESIKVATILSNTILSGHRFHEIKRSVLSSKKGRLSSFSWLAMQVSGRPTVFSQV